MAKSPAVILFDVAGNPMAVEDGVAIPVGTTAIVAAGSDGTDAHFLLVDSTGSPIVVGAGVAGTPAGGVVSIQGVVGGTAVPVTGSVSVANASVSANNAAAPGSSTQVGGTDGTNLQSFRVFDADTGGGTQYVLGALLRKSASGGSVEAGTSTDPLRVDPTGTTTQPVSAASLPLPTGAATEATLATRLADATFTGRINTLGQKTMANSTPVVLSSDQSAIPVTDNSGSLTVDTTQLPAALVGGRLDENVGAWLGSTAPTVGSKTSANSVPVVIASDQGAVAISAASLPLPTGAATAANQTTLGSQTTKVNDGTNTAAVKAASTAAVATDPALVVAISPNNTITTSNASVGTNNSAIPTSSTQVGGSDGTNLQAARVFDGDTGAGTQYVLGAILRKAASGGTVEAGTSADPLRVDPTGTTTQPISAASLPLPTGAATEATLSTRLADATFTGRINTLGQKTSANSTPVVLASDQSSIPVTDAGGSLTVDGTVTANQGTAAALAGYWPVRVTDGTNTMPTADNAARSSFHRVTDGTNTATVKAASTAAVAGDTALVVAVSPNNTVAISAASLPLPTGAATEATLATRLADATFTGRINTLGQKTSANSTPVVLASDQSAIPITDNSGSLTVDSAQLPAALVGARLDVNNGAWLGSTAPTVGQKTMANSVPTVIASDQSALPVNVVGTHANAWNAAVTGVNGNSAVVDCQYTPHITVFGNTNNSTTMSIQASQDNTNFYTIATFSASAGDFGSSFTFGARYLRLQSSNSRTVTATIAGKD